MTKVCNRCGVEKSKEEFHSNGSTPLGTKKYKPYCKECTNKDSGLNKVLKIKESLRILGRLYKCELCGYDKNYSALHFHHIDSDNKSFEISDKSWTSSIKSLIPEIEKCAVLCANCHAEMHNPALNNSV